jgi:uncharacterized protein YndB with AHSA1/START domain
MPSVERTFVVTRPQADVFTYLSDFTNTEQWDPGTVRTTRTDSGPIGLGATFHNVSKFRGRTTELDYELTEYQPDSRLVFTGNNKTVTSTDNLSFAEVAGGTSITYRANFDFHGAAKLAGPFVKLGLGKLADETVEQMTSAIEQH